MTNQGQKASRSRQDALRASNGSQAVSHAADDIIGASHVVRPITRTLGPKVLAVLAHAQRAILVDDLKRHFPDTSRHHLLLILRDLEIRGEVRERRRKALRYFGLKGFQVGVKPRYPDSSTAIFKKQAKPAGTSWWLNAPRPDFYAAARERFPG